LTIFATLTLDPKKLIEIDEPEKYISNIWRKLRVYLKRYTGESVKFIAVKEWQKNGYPHLHVLLNKYIPQDWLSDTWSSLGGGKIVDIRQIKDIEITGRYVCKYLTKGMMSAPKGTRRYTTSRGIKLNTNYIPYGQQELFDVKKKSGWELKGHGVEDYYYASAPDIIREELDTDGSLKSFSTIKRVVEGLI
jgi:hypothetical protein